ncbi:MAG: glycosyltransferase family 4 protein [Desulfobulbaceae bacterium]|nr:glycosyltransferase family 4 protein [Desulfobulbaceae bacterium]
MKELHLAILAKKVSLTGGMERYVAEVARRMLERGHRVDLYAREYDPELLPGASFVPIGQQLNSSSVLSALSFARQSASLLQGKCYDVVHSHERGFCQDILTLHCFSHRSGMARYPSWRIDQKYLSPRNQAYLWLERRQMKTTDLVAVSEIIAKDLFSHYHRSFGVSVIEPGVDTEWFHPAKVAELRGVVRKQENIAPNDFVVLFVGSEFRRKGLDLLIPAIGRGMRLLVVGAGERHAYFRSLAVQCGLAEQVHFLGLRDDVRRFYAAADVVVLPSRSEAFGMSILEGMACGLPVVAAAQTGVAELIVHGVNGLIASSPDQLHSVLQQLTNDALRRDLGIRARDTAEAYSWNRVADRYEELYRRVAVRKLQGDSSFGVCR